MDSRPAGVTIGDTFLPTAVKLEADCRKGAPNVSARFELRDGLPETVRFIIESKPDGRPARTADLRDWGSLESLALYAFELHGTVHQYDSAGRSLGATSPQDDSEGWQVRRDVESGRSKPRTPSHAELAEVARVYKEAVGRRPTSAVQVQLGYTYRTAARRVQQARAAGLLPKTKQGKRKA